MAASCVGFTKGSYQATPGSTSTGQTVCRMDREEDEPLGPGFAVYHFEGLGHVKDIRRLIEIAVYDTLGMENSLQRPRTLAYLAQTALKSLEVGEVRDRLAVLEESV